MTLEALEACRRPSQATLGPLRHRIIYPHHLPRLRQQPPQAHTITMRPKHLRRYILTTTPLPVARIRARIIPRQQPRLVILEPHLLHPARSTLNLERQGILALSLLPLRPTLTEATVLHQVLRRTLHLLRVSNPGRHPRLRLIPAMDSRHRLDRTANTRLTVLHLHLLPRLGKALEATEDINRDLIE